MSSRGASGIRFRRIVVKLSMERSGIVSGTEKMNMEQCTCDSQRFARVGMSVR